MSLAVVSVNSLCLRQMRHLNLRTGGLKLRCIEMRSTTITTSIS